MVLLVCHAVAVLFMVIADVNIPCVCQLVPQTVVVDLAVVRAVDLEVLRTAILSFLI